ncbi:hypothetical protein CCUG63697_03205 [Mycobacteroides franklinii]|uniref:Uncharacterized protein n=1 Tax=Mycobacteroides franklinii TaxID=948102 RepID=A0A4R8QXR9_9MYCO|nr:hypothetical protein CCUG63697_03205 [Mycobacteroides franklinii]TDZ58857.1 hypothetical protein CCUG63696_00832 [Mycobacteroides franklinii]
MLTDPERDQKHCIARALSNYLVQPARFVTSVDVALAIAALCCNGAVTTLESLLANILGDGAHRQKYLACDASRN